MICTECRLYGLCDRFYVDTVHAVVGSHGAGRSVDAAPCFRQASVRVLADPVADEGCLARPAVGGGVCRPPEGYGGRADQPGDVDKEVIGRDDQVEPGRQPDCLPDGGDAQEAVGPADIPVARGARLGDEDSLGGEAFDQLFPLGDDMSLRGESDQGQIRTFLSERGMLLMSSSSIDRLKRHEEAFGGRHRDAEHLGKNLEGAAVRSAEVRGDPSRRSRRRPIRAAGCRSVRRRGGP